MHPAPLSQDTLRRVLLRVPNRRRIFEAIAARPGIHARALARDLELAFGSIEHHLHALEKHDLVFANQVGRRRCLYLAGHVDHGDANILNALAKPAWKELLQALCDDPEVGVAELAGRVELPPPNVSYHLRRMRDLGLLENHRIGRQSIFLVHDPARLRRLLEKQQAAKRGVDACFVGLVERATERPSSRPQRLVVQRAND